MSKTTVGAVKLGGFHKEVRGGGQKAKKQQRGPEQRCQRQNNIDTAIGIILGERAVRT